MFISLTSSCSLFILDADISPDEYLPDMVLIVADKSIYPEIESGIDRYQKDISSDGISSSVLLWAPDSGNAELKTTLQSYKGKAEAAFLIGDIPPAWYEMTAFGKYEVFPSDIYYMDLDSAWTDSDGNGYFDSHSELETDIYVSRLTGTTDEINFYLDKLHAYRDGSGVIYDGAFIFKDDDWQLNYRSNDFGLSVMYGSVDFYQDEDNTTRKSYENRMLGSGYEYVYQWIHAYPSALFVDVDDSYQIIRALDINNNNYKGNFYNLFDCQAARFTVRNLAASYLTRTDSCIAVLGSTKTGGVYYPMEFHKALAMGACWGASFKTWYNSAGRFDDRWYLGMITMGDPVIRPYHVSGSDLSTGRKSLSTIIPLSEKEKEDLYIQLQEFDPGMELPDELLPEF